MTRGGKRPGSGRPTGKHSNRTEIFYARVTREEKKKLTEYLGKLRELEK